MENIKEFLKGKKTYIVAGAMTLFAALGYALGLLEPAKAGEIFLEALGLAGLRAGVDKSRK